MIDDARLFEHSGPAMALFKWGSSMKQFLLFTIFINVLLLPIGLSGDGSLLSVGFAIVSLLVKMLALGLVIAAIETSFAKLRLYKIPEFIATGFLLAILADVRIRHRGRMMPLHVLTVPQAIAGTTAVLLIVVQLSLFRTVVISEMIRDLRHSVWPSSRSSASRSASIFRPGI